MTVPYLTGFDYLRHLAETRPVEVDSAPSVIDISLYIGPVGFRFYQRGVILNLIFQTVALLVLSGGHSGVKGHPQRKAKDGFPTAHLIAYSEYIRVCSPPLLSTQDTGKTPGNLS